MTDPDFTETKASDWWAARLEGQRLPSHELHPELIEDLEENP